MRLGLSGHLTERFIGSPLTPLILLAAIVLGTVALFAIPREEEPQISVPMVDVHVRADGLRAPDAVELVTKPLETLLKGVDAVEHVYSQTVDDAAIVTARFEVGTDADDAIVRVHEKIRANLDRIPIDVPEPLVVGRGINDVPIVALTLSPKPHARARWDDNALLRVADELQAELATVADVGTSFVVGGRADQIRVEPDPEKLALHGITLQQLIAKVRGANRSFQAGRLGNRDRSLAVAAGQTMSGVPDIGLLLLTARDGRPVYVRDVARVVVGAAPARHRVWHLDAGQDFEPLPAVTVALAKREGANAVVVAEAVLERFALLQGRLVPDDVAWTLTRDYGHTAAEKADELLFHLALATVSIVLLIVFAIGWRAGVVTLIVIPTTILLTLFASHLLGYTINRVSLFALIFAIGILVDDAIVVIENVSRHWAMGDGRSRARAAVEAVAEVGNPTVVATLTVIVALLPMLFVGGLMGPYMAPIPVNASAAMVFSFFVAVAIAPWLMLRLAGSGRSAGAQHGDPAHGEGTIGRLYRRVAAPLLASRGVALGFLLLVARATVASTLLFASRDVTVKLLPFDNKSEFQVVVDLPEGSSLERTGRVLLEAARRLAAIPEITSMQAYAGTAAPFNFNGLVRHYYLRQSPELGDLQVNLAGKDARGRASHAIALEARRLLAGLEAPAGTSVKVVEVPPGPPVLATLLAEVYGPDAASRRAAATELRRLFERVPFVVDTDTSMGEPAARYRIASGQGALEFRKVAQPGVYATVEALLQGVPVGYSHRGEGRDPAEIAIRLPNADLAWTERLASTPVPANLLPGGRGVVELGDVVRVTEEAGSHVVFRRNGRFAELVMAELAGAFEAPVYGMLAVADLLPEGDWQALGLPVPAISLYGQPADESGLTVLWDGEWQITWVTFRDMGAAFAVAILGIYILVVAQFGSFLLPLVILTPVPLTLIGIMLGHLAFGAHFTATSMIGFIALAGIIVRNSILLVDFIRHGAASGADLRERLLAAGAIRSKPILLTALAAMIGAAVILFDPIFQGLAISLLFGLASSTLLTVLVIPAIYIVFRGGRPVAAAP